MSRLRWPSLFQMAASLVLLLSALFELFDTVIEQVIGIEIDTAHGVIVYAVVKLVKEAVELRDQYGETCEKIGEVRHAIAEEKAPG